MRDRNTFQLMLLSLESAQLSYRYTAQFVSFVCLSKLELNFCHLLIRILKAAGFRTTCMGRKSYRLHFDIKSACFMIKLSMHAVA